MDLSEREAIVGPFCRHPWEQARARFLVEHLQKLHRDGDTILDIGCGDAYVLSQLRAAFPNSPCLGVDTAFRGQTECPPGVEIYSHTEELPALVRPASVILLMDVLEHVEEPVELLHSLRRQGLADSRTLVFVTVPAYQWLFSETDRWLGHYRRYRRGLLSRQLAAAGIELHESGYFFLSLLLVRLGEVLLERLRLRRTQSTGLVNWSGGPWLSSGLAHLLQWDYRLTSQVRAWLGACLPGLSCYGVGRFS